MVGTPAGARCPPRCDEHPFPRLGGGVRHPWVPPASWAHRVKAGTSRPPQHCTRTDLCRGRRRCVRRFPLYPFVCGVVEAFLNFHRVCSIQSESFSLVIQRTMLVLQSKLGTQTKSGIYISLNSFSFYYFGVPANNSCIRLSMVATSQNVWARPHQGLRGSTPSGCGDHAHVRAPRNRAHRAHTTPNHCHVHIVSAARYSWAATHPPPHSAHSAPTGHREASAARRPPPAARRPLPAHNAR